MLADAKTVVVPRAQRYRARAMSDFDFNPFDEATRRAVMNDIAAGEWHLRARF